MKKIRDSLEKRAKKRNLQKVILNIVANTGIIAVGLVAPNVLGAMAKLGFIPYKRQKESILRARKRLIDRGLLKFNNGNLEITQEGRVHLVKEGLYEQDRNKNKKWDGKWRVLIFDIPEKKRRTRDLIRTTLISIGFMRLQDSVWVYPYNCEDLVTLLKADMKVGKDILYMIVEELEYDKPVRSYFGLNSH